MRGRRSRPSAFLAGRCRSGRGGLSHRRLRDQINLTVGLERGEVGVLDTPGPGLGPAPRRRGLADWGGVLDFSPEGRGPDTHPKLSYD